MNRHLHYKTKAKLIIIPGLSGFLFFYAFPMAVSLYYSLIDNNFRRNFVGFNNYAGLFENEYYALAFSNTLAFTAVGTALLLLFSFVVSVMFVYAGKRFSALRAALILPMLLPTAGIALVWRGLFNPGGALSAFTMTEPGLASRMLAPQLLPLYLIFVWKYGGLAVVLVTGAIYGVDKSVYEAAAVDGARGIKLHALITAPMIRPTIFFTLVLTAANSFNIYREVFYLFGGDYPPDAAYLLQHFMNNHFRRLNYQTLSSGALVFVAVLLALISILYFWDNRKAAPQRGME